jgi:hypothetical protein
MSIRVAAFIFVVVLVPRELAVETSNTDHGVVDGHAVRGLNGSSRLAAALCVRLSARHGLTACQRPNNLPKTKQKVANLQTLAFNAREAAPRRQQHRGPGVVSREVPPSRA